MPCDMPPQMCRRPMLQQCVVLSLVALTLYIDNMLYTGVVTFVPQYLEQIGANDRVYNCKAGSKTLSLTSNGDKQGKLEHFGGPSDRINCHQEVAYSDQTFAVLFATKAFAQLLATPVAAVTIDRIGPKIPLVMGLVVMSISTLGFAVGNSFWAFVVARSLQGLGAALADTGGLAMIAGRFTSKQGRVWALALAVVAVVLGSISGPPGGGILIAQFGKAFLFLLLALVCLCAANLVMFLIDSQGTQTTNSGKSNTATPMWRLLGDPYVLLCTGALIIANAAFAFTEIPAGAWMYAMTGKAIGYLGLLWFFSVPAFLGAVISAACLMTRFPHCLWAVATTGALTGGVGILALPWMTSLWLIVLDLSILAISVGLIGTALLVVLGFLVDSRHTPVYGSVYALPSLAFSIAYPIGTIFGPKVVSTVGFAAMAVGISFVCVLYSPALVLLCKVCKPDAVNQAEPNACGECGVKRGNDGKGDYELCSERDAGQ